MKRGSVKGVGVLEAGRVKGFPPHYRWFQAGSWREITELKDEKWKKGILGEGMAWAKVGRYAKGKRWEWDMLLVTGSLRDQSQTQTSFRLRPHLPSLLEGNPDGGFPIPHLNMGSYYSIPQRKLGQGGKEAILQRQPHVSPPREFCGLYRGTLSPSSCLCIHSSISLARLKWTWGQVLCLPDITHLGVSCHGFQFPPATSSQWDSKEVS